MDLERSPESLALDALLLRIVIIKNMEYHRFDQSITNVYNYFESGPLDQMCKEFYF